LPRKLKEEMESKGRKKVLVTGGSGFIGTNLVNLLTQRDDPVVIFDKEPSRSWPDLCIEADVRDQDALDDALTDVGVVFHLAAAHRDDVRPVSLYHDVNVGGAENLVEAAEKNGVDKIIFTSSVALYGLNVGTPTEDSPARPFNDYGQSKHDAERVFRKWADADPRRTLVIVRPVVIFGEDNRGNVYNLLKQLTSGMFVMVGAGKNQKSMGYVLNIAGFLAHCLDLAPGTHVFNFADKPDITMRELVAMVRKSLGKSGVPLSIPYPIGLCGGYVFDALSRLTNKSLSISSIRIKKFCADTTVSADRIAETGFTSPHELRSALERVIEYEFPAARD
jgi:nucleoside-diphosphate-sugar epimerase